MTDKDPRTDKFNKERGKQADNFIRLRRDADTEITSMLRTANGEIKQILASMPSNFDALVLPQLQASIRNELQNMGTNLATRMGNVADNAKTSGVNLIDAPLAAGGVNISAVLTSLDSHQVRAIRAMMTNRLKDVANEAINKINAELGLVVIGTRTQGQAVTEISRILGATSPRALGAHGIKSRALTITRTEIGRVYSTAAQERLTAANEYLPNLKKQWRRSGKLHSRMTHDLADGQVVNQDEKFQVGGEELEFPRDPKGSAKNTINCGCIMLPFMQNWEVRHPADRPITDIETANNTAKRRTREVRDTSFGRWVENLSNRTTHPRGHFETVAQIDDGLMNALRARGVNPVTREIAVSDRRINHMLRDTKTERNAALPTNMISRFPAQFDAPRAILWDNSRPSPTLVYVFDVPETNRLAQVPVRLKANQKRENITHHNYVMTSGLVQPENLTGERFELIRGRIR